MAAPRPSYHRSVSRSNRDHAIHEDKERLSRHNLPVHDQHARSGRPNSPPRARHPYTSNCGRRRWPPSPKVEEVKWEEEIPMRGKIGQDPMIIDVPYSTSNDSGSTYSRDSDDSSEPETPSASDSDNSDRRYIWKPKPDVPIPQSYDTAKYAQPKKQETMVDTQGSDRGRKAMPKLDTNLGQNRSIGGPPPQLERARSPYASGPQERKTKADRFSGEYLLSPDPMSSRRLHADSPRSQSQHFPRAAESHTHGSQTENREGPQKPLRPSIENQRAHSHYVPRPMEAHSGGREAQGTDSPGLAVRPSLNRRASEMPYPSDSPSATKRATQDLNAHRPFARPSLERRASEMPYPITPPSAGEVRQRSRRLGGSRDGSDSEYATNGGKSGQSSPRTPLQHKATTSNDERHHKRQFSSELPTTPPRRSLPPSNVDGPPVNLSSLVSGAAIHQTLAAMLNKDHNAARRASPRPSPHGSPFTSPRGSPKTSPYSSPSRTPPSEPPYHRANPIAGLKKDSPSSRPSSPLSSRSSTWTMEPGSKVSESDHSAMPRPATLRSRQTAPLPVPKLEKSAELAPPTPGISVRSPSPARHAGSSLAELDGSLHSGSRSQNILGQDPSHSASLQRPTGFAGRPRSVSSADVRPQLTVNPAPFLQNSESSSSRSRSRARSPSVLSPSDRYKPANLEPALRSNSSYPNGALASNARPRSRSRSYIPEFTPPTPMAPNVAPGHSAPAFRSSSTVPAPTSADPRSRFSAPSSIVPSSTDTQPLSLPICPRPHPVTGYNDWFALSQNTAFTICPSCRDSVFGADNEQYLQPRPVSSTRKIQCDLNNPWIRLACLLRGPDVNLLSALSNVTSKERACPEDELAPRDWYRLEDADNRKHIPGVNVCPHCVHSLEILFPHWRDVFYRSRSSHQHELKERFCSLRSSDVRFGDYLDMIVESSREAESRRKSPNTRPVSDLAKQLAAIDDCPRDKMNPRKAWHIHPHLPEFTICQDCYETVVYPLVKSGSPLAAKIDKKPQQFPNPDVKCCCNLYSPRMRKVLREACEDDDYEHLRHTVLKRHMLQQDLLATLGEKEEHPRDDEITGRLQELAAKWKDKE